MISELEISGYKALKSLKLEGLKRLTLLGGKNNTGKTSVLEAFFLSLDWANTELLTRHLHWRGIEIFNTSPDTAWTSSFFNFDLQNKIQIRTRGPQGDRLTFLAQVIDTPRRATAEATTAANPPEGVQNVRIASEFALRITYTRGSKQVYEALVTATGGIPPYQMKVVNVEEKPLIVHFSAARSRTSPADDARNFGKLDEQKRTGELVAALQAIEPKLRGLSVIPVGPQSQLYADVEGFDRKIPINLMGDGLTRLVSMLLQVSNVAGGYLLVDEIENGFHYSVMPMVWEALYGHCKSQKCQLIATTHSYECLTAFADGLKEIATDDYGYFRLDRKDGAVVPVPYKAEALRNATGEGWEVR